MKLIAITALTLAIVGAAAAGGNKTYQHYRTISTTHIATPSVHRHFYVGHGARVMASISKSGVSLKQRMQVHLADHRWAVAKPLHRLGLHKRLRAYEQRAAHDRYVIANSPRLAAYTKRHKRELLHANAHIKKIETRLHPAVDINAWPWGPLVQCEAHGNWQYNGDDGDIFEGGPNFHPQTWDDYKWKVPGASQYEAAYDAPPTVQIAVAEVVLAENGWGAWPECSYTIGAR